MSVALQPLLVKESELEIQVSPSSNLALLHADAEV